jgi:ABC-type molybdate transport system permease subunit
MKKVWREDALRPAFSVTARMCLALPLLAVSVLFAAVAVIGVARLPDQQRAAMAADYARAATTAVICLILAIPAASCRPTLVWVVPLGATAAAGAAGWALLPLPEGPFMDLVEGAVLLLPVMVLVLGVWWRHIPRDLAILASEAGASRFWVFRNVTLPSALPGVARALALVFVLALGLAPLLAPAQVSP